MPQAQYGLKFSYKLLNNRSFSRTHSFLQIEFSFTIKVKVAPIHLGRLILLTPLLFKIKIRAERYLTRSR